MTSVFHITIDGRNINVEGENIEMVSEPQLNLANSLMRREVLIARAEMRKKEQGIVADKKAEIKEKSEKDYSYLLEQTTIVMRSILLEKTDDGDYNIKVEDVERLRELEILGRTRDATLHTLDEVISIMKGINVIDLSEFMDSDDDFIDSVNEEITDDELDNIVEQETDDTPVTDDNVKTDEVKVPDGISPALAAVLSGNNSGEQ